MSEPALLRFYDRIRGDAYPRPRYPTCWREAFPTSSTSALDALASAQANELHDDDLDLVTGGDRAPPNKADTTIAAKA